MMRVFSGIETLAEALAKGSIDLAGVPSLTAASGGGSCGARSCPPCVSTSPVARPGGQASGQARWCTIERNGPASWPATAPVVHRDRTSGSRRAAVAATSSSR